MAPAHFLPSLVAFAVFGVACAPIKTEVRDTVVWRGPIEKHPSSAPSQWTPVVAGNARGSSLAIHVTWAQLCEVEYVQQQRIRRETIRNGHPYVGIEILSAVVLSATAAWFVASSPKTEQGGDTTDKSSTGDRARGVVGAVSLTLAPAAVIVAGVDTIRAVDSEEELEFQRSRTEAFSCAEKPARALAVAVVFSNGVRAEVVTDDRGNAEVPIPAELLVPGSSAAGSAAVMIAGARRARILIPGR